MTVLITPANGPWAATLNVPADGESVNSASVVGYMQEVANRLEYLRQRTPGANPVANLIRLQASVSSVFVPTNWALVGGASASPLGLNQTTIGVIFLPWIPLTDLLTGMIIRGFTVFARGATAHAALPATMPKVELIRVDTTTLAITVVDTQSDVSANTAAYQVVHTIAKTLGAPETVLSTALYYLRLSGEDAANALAGLNFFSASVDVSA